MARVRRPGESLHLFLLGVAQGFAGRGIAQRLVAECLAHGRHDGYQVEVTEATNEISQHVFRRQGFVERLHRSCTDYRCEGHACFTRSRTRVGRCSWTDLSSFLTGFRSRAPNQRLEASATDAVVGHRLKP